jgi:hypothetical protein
MRSPIARHSPLGGNVQKSHLRFTPMEAPPGVDLGTRLGSASGTRLDRVECVQPLTRSGLTMRTSVECFETAFVADYMSHEMKPSGSIVLQPYTNLMKDFSFCRRDETNHVDGSSLSALSAPRALASVLSPMLTTLRCCPFSLYVAGMKPTLWTDLRSVRSCCDLIT